MKVGLPPEVRVLKCTYIPTCEYFISDVAFMSLLISIQLPPARVLAADQPPTLSNGPLPSRQQLIESLQKDEFDILVVGGGASGTGVALDAVSRGMFMH